VFPPLEENFIHIKLNKMVINVAVNLHNTYDDFDFLDLGLSVLVDELIFLPPDLLLFFTSFL